MYNRAKPWLMAAVTLVTLTVTVVNAAAYRSLTIERGGAIRQTSQGKITFNGGLVSVACNVTLTGELSTGALTGEFPIAAGQVTRLSWRECTGGEIVEILGLPWAISITKLLERENEARIAGIRPEALTGGQVTLGPSGAGAIGFELSIEGTLCLYGAGGRAEVPTATLPLTRVRAEGGKFYYTLGDLTVLESVRFRRLRGIETCPGEGVIRGRFNAAEPAQTAIFE